MIDICGSICVGFILLALGANGCTDFQKANAYGRRADMEQSQTLGWGQKFDMQIVKSTWDGPNLVVDVSITYSGTDPGTPVSMPLFQLQSADGKHFVPNDGAEITMQLVTNNYNPGASRTAHLVFPVPYADFSLLMENGGTQTYLGAYPTTGVVVYVCHLQPTGGYPWQFPSVWWNGARVTFNTLSARSSDHSGNSVGR